MLDIETHAGNLTGTAETGSCLSDQPPLAPSLLAGSQAVFQPTEHGPKQSVSLLGLAHKKPHAVSAPSLSPAASWTLMPKVTLEVTCWRWQSPCQFHSQRTSYEHNLKPLLGLPWWSNG